MAAASITPVTVLTGFLGSGKTTLLNRMLDDERYRDTAVVVNEWGEIPIDHALVREASGEVVVLAGGCICCRAASGVSRALRELHFARLEKRVPAFSRVVIETSGLADPAPLMATLVEMPLAAARFALGGVITTVDAEHGMATLDAHPESVAQVAVADRIVVTKAGRASASHVETLEARLRELNPAATAMRAESVDPARLFHAGLYRGPGAAMDARGWLQSNAYRPAGRDSAARHDPRIASFAWTRKEPCRLEDVESAVAALLARHGEHVLRMKGLVHVRGEPGPRAVHAVHHTLYPSARLPAWPDGDRATRLVFILRDLVPAEAAVMLDPIATPATS